MEFRLASAAFIAVFATYLFLGGMGVTDPGNPHPRDAPYNLLARGLLSGHLYVDREAPPILAKLRDPYDPEANMAARDVRGRLHDFSYFRGRLYLYFGIAPALLIFVPWHLLTGGWLPHWLAVVFLCSAGLLVSLSFVRAVKARILPDASPWLTAICTLVLGLGSGAPLLAARADMWEIPIAFSYLAVSLALRCLWEAFENPSRSARWIAFASAALGAGFAARPTVLPNAAILLVPFVSRETRRNAWAWAAAAAPLALCGAGVALYNAERFGSPFEYGVRYTLEKYTYSFSPGFVWTNLGFYLFQGTQWSSVFPFVHERMLDPLHAHLPPNHAGAEHISGALLNAPILLAALAVPALIRLRRSDRGLLLIAVSAAWVALSSLALFSFFYFVCARYQFEFVPALALLASVGVMAIEGAWGGRFRAIARCAWIPALAVSSVFPVLYGIDRCALDHNIFGFSCLAYGDLPGAGHEFETAKSLSPGNPHSRLGSGLMLALQGRLPDARAALEALVRDFPDYAMGHFFLGNVLSSGGHRDEAIAQFRAAHRLDPENVAIKAALDSALGPRK
jgi:tetratricopeptide (TPR) repeat protein